MPFSAKQHSLLQYCNLMVDAAPLANQHSSRPQFARRRRRLYRAARSSIIGYAIEQAADSWFETAERTLLRTVCSRVSQQLMAMWAISDGERSKVHGDSSCTIEH